MVELSADEIEELRGRAQSIDAQLQVGKAGISDGFVEELEATLKREGLVKLRLLRAARTGTSTEETAEALADRVDAALVETRGNTVVLYNPYGDR